MNCDDCANKDTYYCLICKDYDFHRTKQEKEAEDMMCDLLCGSAED